VSQEITKKLQRALRRVLAGPLRAASAWLTSVLLLVIGIWIIVAARRESDVVQGTAGLAVLATILALTSVALQARVRIRDQIERRITLIQHAASVVARIGYHAAVMEVDRWHLARLELGVALAGLYPAEQQVPITAALRDLDPGSTAAAARAVRLAERALRELEAETEALARLRRGH
jgi:uncharacterized membrane protein